MIKSIKVFLYKNLKDINFSFSPGINVISGNNGTGKTTLLHIISNSFKAIQKNDLEFHINNEDFFDIFRATNSSINPKIEKLVKGDKTYNDPARGHSGPLFEVTYTHHEPNKFRKHNHTKNINIPRYSIKPIYSPKKGQTLPACPVVYLSLNRLIVYGEHDDKNLKKIAKILPENIVEEINKKYKYLTGIDRKEVSTEKMSGLKTRQEFKTSTEGVDSNTISSGEDNLSIILTAIYSLVYYYNSANNKNAYSILLIDELDATLHPSIQIKILKIFEELSNKHNIQIIFTTHSLSIIDYSLDKKYNLIYLIRSGRYVTTLDDITKYNVRMYSLGSTKNEMIKDKKIVVYTEDEQARELIKLLFEYRSKNDSKFSKIQKCFYFLEANFGSNNLISLFSDINLSKITQPSICILDGDQKEEIKKVGTKDVIFTLPGNTSPEKMLFDYVCSLGDEKRNQLQKEISNERLDELLQDIENFEKQSGTKRKNLKECYNKNKEILKTIFSTLWITDQDNKSAVRTFFNKLKKAYKKVADYNDLDPNMW